jgi:transposase
MRPFGRGGHDRRLQELEQENRQLRQQLQRALEENERPKREHERLKQEIERLRRQLEEALRAAKGQAAPYSRGEPKADPKRPGRKAGEKYGRHSCQPIPRRVEERIAVPLPLRCNYCQGPVEFDGVVDQYQEDIVRRTKVRRF